MSNLYNRLSGTARTLYNRVWGGWDRLAGKKLDSIIQKYPKATSIALLSIPLIPLAVYGLYHLAHSTGLDSVLYNLSPIGSAYGESTALTLTDTSTDAPQQGIINVKVNDHPYDLRIFTDPGHQIQPTVNRTPDGFQIVFTNLKGDDVDGFYFFAHNNRYDFNDEILAPGPQTVIVPDIVPRNLPSDVYQQQADTLSKELIGAASAGTAGAICTGLTVQRLLRHRKRK